MAASVLLFAAACSRPRLWLEAPEQSEAERLVVQADVAARADDARRARDLYQEALRKDPGDEVGPRALYGLALLHVDPDSRLRDYPAARRLFGQLVTRYPHSAWTREARAWRATLGDLVRQEADAARLRGDMERLKALDVEMEDDR
jgi:tetratricopeptide (TPR) repeat protein